MDVFTNGKRHFHSFIELYVIRPKNQGVKIWSKYHFKEDLLVHQNDVCKK